MVSFNSVTLIGRLGSEPEARDLNNGKVVSFRMATGERYKDKVTGEYKERTRWHSIAIFNENLGTVALDYLKKGSQVMVQGALKYRTYTTKEGQERTQAEIVLSRFRGELTLLDKAEGNGGSGRTNAGRSSYGEDAPF